MPQCPECDAAVDVDEEEVEEGEVVSCPECGVDLEVVNTNPLELNLLDEEEEDDMDGSGLLSDDDDDEDEEDDEDDDDE